MARFDKSSTKRPKQDAAVAASRGSKRSTAPSIEDTMFFPRLRRHAKWMFVFLAVALAGGFVIFGVGAGAGGTGIGDLFKNNGGSNGAPSVSKALDATVKHPSSVDAWQELSTALQTDGQTDRAIGAQRQVVFLAPKDTDALRELAGLYLTQATVKQQAAQILQLRANYAYPGEGLAGALTSPTGQTIVADKISSKLAGISSNQVQTLLLAAQKASANAVTSYKKVARLSPGDPNVQLELAQTAQQANDYPTAIIAYKEFLKLAPDDPSASIVKQQLKQLKQASG
jgi:tetratricopeptide (TPR) repeat protein